MHMIWKSKSCTSKTSLENYWRQLHKQYMIAYLSALGHDYMESMFIHMLLKMFLHCRRMFQYSDAVNFGVQAVFFNCARETKV